MTPSFDFQLCTRVVFGAGGLSRLTELARELSFTRTLVVADAGIVATGHVARVAAYLWDAGAEPFFLRLPAEPKQWTGTFNPRPFDAAGALSLYERAY